VLPTKRFKVTIDKDDLVARGVITPEQAETIPGEIRWEINRETLYRHQLMMIDLIGTNKFRRDINIMNPGYIKDVYPLVDLYSMQEGMVHKLTPYPVANDKKFNTELSYNYFMNGDGTGKLKWGNLNSPDIYIENAVTQNSAIVQRQTYGILAQQLIDEGKIDKAKDMLNEAEVNFPKENFPLDRYSIIFLQLYADVQDTEKANMYFDEILKYYEQELAYFSQFKGKKARGVQGSIQDAAQAVYILYTNAERTLKDSERAAKAKAVLDTYIGPIGM
jgi:tetratricopeptide (TPR) repeat protein